MREKKFFRTCPKCGKEIGHVSAKNRDYAAAKGNKCNPCSNKGRPFSTEHRAKISAGLKGKTLSAEHKANMGAAKRVYKKSVKEAYTEMYGVKAEPNVNEHKKWANQVKKRDDYQCQCCGKEKTTPKSMHAHHIVLCGYFPELAIDLSNGITLCAGCHRSLHADLDRLTLAGIKLDTEGFGVHASDFIKGKTYAIA